jgi:protein-disulfide isomerase/uncharacterized membrane protein
MSTTSVNKRLPFKVYYFTIVGIVAIGLADSIYLSISHYRVYTDMAYESFCAISKAINCDTVSQSPYSIFWGVPVPVWGILGYAFFLGALFLAGQKRAEHKRLWVFLQLTAFSFCLYSVVLALISTYWIHSYCIMCILSYGVNLGLLYFVWIIRKRFDSTRFWTGLKNDFKYIKQLKIKSAAVFGLPILTACGLILFLPPYWQLKPIQPDLKIEHGLTQEGQPYLGSSKAEFTITEFIDYQCFQCRKMHFFLRRLIGRYPDKAKLIQRHFPMDSKVNPGVKTPLHVGSGKMALLAIYASAKGKFWQMNDLLFDMAARKKNFNLKEIAEKTGIDQRELAWALNSKKVYQRLALDLKEGGELGLEGTPGFLIEGKVYQGNIPYKVLERIFFKAK